MSLAVATSPCTSPFSLAGPRKRTSSFSCPTATFTPNPRPTKIARKQMGSLRRTDSFVSLTDLQSLSCSTQASSTARNEPPTTLSASNRTERGGRRRPPLSRNTAVLSSAASGTSKDSIPPIPPPPTTRAPAPVQASHPQVQHSSEVQQSSEDACLLSSTSTRRSSPLAPMRAVLPARPSFPRSKAEPDLYRQAITTRMRFSPEGQKILHMGPRLALSIMSATKELERLVATQVEAERESTDVLMSDAPPLLSNSWVVVPGEDWEMVECGA